MKLTVFVALVAILGHINGLTHSSDELGRHHGTSKRLLGRLDGHDRGNPSIGRKDGHEPPLENKKLIGRPDGHDSPLNRNVEKTEEYDWDDLTDEEVKPEKEESLVRCKRPQCDASLSCRFGPQRDVNGCPICKCLEDPCIEEGCETGYACRPIECPENGPCKKLKAKCEKKRCKGPEPMCSDYCPFGYRLNDRGCTTCVCRDTENLHNFTAEGISTEDSSSSEDEDDEYYDDDDDDDEDSLIIEDLDEHLREEMEADDDEEEEEEDYHDGDVDEYSKNEDRRQGEMCEGTTCRPNEICRSSSKYSAIDMEEKKKKLGGMCAVKTRCWALINEPRLYSDHVSVDRRQTCDPTMSFRPLQCMGYNPNSVKNKTKTCWCTNDLGYVIDGTFTVIYAEEQKPICERNTTISATISMKFRIGGRGTGDKTIVEILNEQLSKITYAPKGSVKIVSVDYPTLQEKHSPQGAIGVNFILTSHPDYDLPYALDLLFNVDDLRFESDMYAVELSEKPRVVHYQFSSPAPPTVGEEDDRDLVGLEPLPHFHQDEVVQRYGGRGSSSFLNRTLVIVCLVVLSVLILVVITIIMILARRNCSSGHIRHHQLQNQISVAIDPEQLLSDPSKNESVILVTDDVLSKVKDSAVA